MEVELISYSNLGEKVCGIASKTCVSKDIPSVDDEVKKSLESAIASNHTAVLEHWSATFAVSGVSRALTHQLVRHRVASYSQQSQRYVRMAYSSRDPFDYVLPDSIKDNPDARALFENHMRATAEVYGRLVDCYKLPMEDARYILPNACTTNIIVSMNARELRHFFALRCCTRAQWEIRELAEKMLALVKPVAPVLFADAGPSCRQLLYCPEENGCGAYPKITEMYVRVNLGGQIPDCKTCRKGFVKWEAPDE